MDHSIEETHLINKRNGKHLFRKQLFEAWCHECAYCGASADTLDHVKPRHKGGATIAANLVPACKNCNRRKGSEDWQQWFSRQDSWTVNRVLKIQDWLACSSIDEEK